MTTLAPTEPRVDAYPTRGVEAATITPRLDPVVHGDLGGPLEPEHIRTFEDTGVLVIPNLLSSTLVAALDAEVGALAEDDDVRAREEAVLEPGGGALRSLFAVHELDGLLGAVTKDHQLVRIARQLLGGDVYIHQSRINLKPGFRGKEFYWHSDFETWHAEDGMPRMRAVSASVLLTPNDPWNGPLLTISGSHKWFTSCVGETPPEHFRESLRKQEIGVPDDDSLRELARRGQIQQALGPAGTVVFFECNVMHGSNGNISPDPRRNVFLVFNSVENTLEEPFAAPAPRPEHIASRTFDPV